ncbi:MAG: hypothetical protein ACOCZ5_01030 [bacterium]
MLIAGYISIGVLLTLVVQFLTKKSIINLLYPQEDSLEMLSEQDLQEYINYQISTGQATSKENIKSNIGFKLKE